jgi:hypothetical protein
VLATGSSFVLVQGTAAYDSRPDRELLESRIGPASARFLGEPRRGPFWDRWLSAYFEDRVVVTVQVERVLSWHDLGCGGEPTVTGSARPHRAPDSQAPPGKGTAPRVDAARAARRMGGLPHSLLGYLSGDGFPVVAPVTIGAANSSGIALTGHLPPGGRRAGVLAHRYGPQLVALQVRQHTGWLQDGVYAPHTETGFRAPANKTLLLLANGFMARRGLKQARALGRA